MPLVPCPDCKTEVSDKAAACPKCGRPVAPIQIPRDKTSSTTGKGCLVVVSGLIGLAMLGALADAVLPSRKAETFDPKAAAVVKAQADSAAAAARAAREQRCASIDYRGLQDTLIHRSTDDGRYVYVTTLWYGLALEQKQSTARYLATCKSGGSWVKIYDSNTGKQLAEYGSFGYSNYEG